MKIRKKNTFTDLYIQQSIGISGEIQVFKLQLKKEYAENHQLRAHFVSNVKGLKNISGKHLLTFLQLIDNDQETAILCQTKNVKSLPDYLAGKENISDAELTELFKQMGNGLETLHQSMLYYPVLQPSSFLVDDSANVQLSLFDILEFRMHQFQQITPDSKQEFMHYLSPERSVNFFSISIESDIYSLGLIYWHVFVFSKSPVKNWKLITENKYFAPTETIWDSFFESCLNNELKFKSDNKIANIINLLPKNSNVSSHSIGEKENSNIDIAKSPKATNESRRSKKSFKALFLVLFIGALGTTFWKVGLFTDEPIGGSEPPLIITTPDVAHPAGTIASVDAQPGITKKAPAPISPGPKSDNKNPAGYTVLETAKTYITKGGYTTPSSGVTYRYFNGKWETKNGASWIPTTTREKQFLLAKCFSKNATPTTPVVPEKAPPPPPPVTKAPGVPTTPTVTPIKIITPTPCNCGTAVAIKTDAENAVSLRGKGRQSKKVELTNQINKFNETCATDCAYQITAAKTAITKIPN
jgi:serine/threonine protein kinase